MGELVKITDLTRITGLSSRSLRYYEQAGLIASVRPQTEKYRYYDRENIERLRQIVVLRKMQIPIKDIIRIYESEDMSLVVETFVARIRSIDQEVDALSELRSVLNDFLAAMTKNGITKISALPLLYEKMEKQMDKAENRTVHGYEEISTLADRLRKSVEPAIVVLPAMRVLSSQPKEEAVLSSPEDFWRWVQTHSLPLGEPGGHTHFEFQGEAGEVTLIKLSADFVNTGPYVDYQFQGGAFATINFYLDEDMRERFDSLISSFDDNAYYEIDYTHKGSLRHEALLEELCSPDGQRTLVSLLVPVKKRIPDPNLFGKPERLKTGAITMAEIEKANPVLWTQAVAMDKLIPINNPHYSITEKGEAEYISWISTRVLSTGVSVKLPFRVDITFRIGAESGGWGHGKKEESIRFHHGEDLNFLFGINMNNSMDEHMSQEAICFHQPIFGDYYQIPKIGAIKPESYNQLSWIVGQNHFAVIINGAVRYCGVNFPYMRTVMGNDVPRPIIIGSDSSIRKYYRAICISQLMEVPKSKMKEGALCMAIERSNNVLPDLHRFITSEYGENYWFNGCARYVMACLGEYKDEPDFGYWFFAGLTGDVLAQVYSYDAYMGESVSSCMFNLEGGKYLEGIFEKCGYASTFVSGSQLCGNKEMYTQTLIAYIDKGIPVIAVTWGGPPWGIYVGYEEHGKTLLYLSGDRTEPERVAAELVFQENKTQECSARGWLFLGEKKREIDLRQVYRDIIMRLPKLLTVKNDMFCFGAEAFYAWAKAIESDRVAAVTAETFDDGWDVHVSNICNMATNGSCAFSFLSRAQELNPDFTFLTDVRRLYERTAEIWNNDNGTDLEALGGGFNVTLANLQEENHRVKIAAKIKEAAVCMDQVLEILNKNISICE